MSSLEYNSLSPPIKGILFQLGLEHEDDCALMKLVFLRCIFCKLMKAVLRCSSHSNCKFYYSFFTKLEYCNVSFYVHHHCGLWVNSQHEQIYGYQAHARYHESPLKRGKGICTYILKRIKANELVSLKCFSSHYRLEPPFLSTKVLVYTNILF